MVIKNKRIFRYFCKKYMTDSLSTLTYVLNIKTITIDTIGDSYYIRLLNKNGDGPAIRSVMAHCADVDYIDNLYEKYKIPRCYLLLIKG